MSLFQLKRAQLTSAASAQRRGFLSSISLFQVGVCSSKSLHPSFAQPPHLFCSSSLSSPCLLFYSARLHRAFCCFLFFFFRWTRNVTFVTHRYSEVKGKKKERKPVLNSVPYISPKAVSYTHRLYSLITGCFLRRFPRYAFKKSAARGKRTALYTYTHIRTQIQEFFARHGLPRPES